jgi:hypothetical protein
LDASILRMSAILCGIHMHLLTANFQLTPH